MPPTDPASSTDLDWLFGPEDPEPDTGEAVPVTVLTGFLGAGKTTLVNRILSEDHGLAVAVLVNDFGEISVDSEIIVGVESGVVSLANGCVCCEVRDDLVAAIGQVLDQRADIDAIVLEASGVAEPMGIARTFTSPGYRGQIRLDGIVAVVDAEQFPDQAQNPATRDLVFAQIGFSDMVVLNKLDLADRERLDEVNRFVRSRLPTVRIIETVRADVPFYVLIGTHPYFGDDLREQDDSRHHAHARFTTWTYRRDDAFDVEALKEAIKHLPSSVYRIKGFLHSADAPDDRHLVQAVGMRGDVEPLDRWGDRGPTTELVIIADADIDQAAVEALLDGCFAPSPRRATT